MLTVKYLRQFLIIFIFTFQFIFPQDPDGQQNCFSILVGKEATIDGSVLFAHNEDDSGINLVNWYKVPRMSHNIDDKIKLFTGGELKQANNTNGLFWLEMPGQSFSDSYANEYGVTIASDACRSNEDAADLVNGGIGYYLRRIMAERARSAKEAVKIAGAIIDSIGYSSSGRTYCIADPNEAWMMSAVNGRHWVAQRVPDDHLAIIPNYYTIQAVDLTDTLNFLGSADIVEYAVKRGWYNPESGKEFNFRLAYGKPSSIKDMRNIARNWGATNIVSPVKYELTDVFPFSFKPQDSIGIQDLMDILHYHYEGTSLEDYTVSSPHDYNILPICRKDTQYGMVAQLRNWLPTEIGTVMWIAPHRPCSQLFIPWYPGITEIPTDFATGDFTSALETHFSNYEDIKSSTSSHNFWKFVNYAEDINNNYYELTESNSERKKVAQDQIFMEFDNFDNDLEKQFRKDPTRAIESINLFTNKMIKVSTNFLDK